MLSRFYLIVDNVERLADYLPLGLKCVQLRVKEATPDELRPAIRAAKALCDEHDCQLIINDYWQLAIEEGCNGLHLGQEDLDGADMTAIRAAGIRCGISTHDKAELERALSLDPDYIALGPVYQTLLKKMPWRPQGLEKLARWKERIGDIPLVAIGGLTPERAAGVFDHGADSVCVVTDVQQHSDPVLRVKQWLDLCSA
ncbi:MAG: thiamine-phosphate pyrophosphorylase [Granulosicoccus sp.]|jgi:thiamine-phosphate pyrophosphorylase